ncbi:MAG: glycosyltransferase family 9 protein [Rhodospirillales bacterium]|nr:glycosyltransferase family 9 protein [Rhodospirillales bacterium]MBO6787274.1 glycosyltransferase family 9 protein [Rhodospirillales bacterium]
MHALFVTSTRVGDAILSTGILSRILEENPGVKVTVACGPAASSLFEAVPGLERVIVLDKMLGSLHWAYMWSQTVGRYWDILVDLRNAPVTYLLAAKKRYRMIRSRDGGHRIRTLSRVISAEDNPPAPKLWVDDARRAAARRLIPEGGPVLAIGPTANWRGKQWRGESFAELIARLTSPGGILPGARVAVFGRDDERPMALPVIESVPSDRLIDLVGRIDLLTVSACLERAALYIGNDSGLMHLSAASGIPTLGLFGPSPADQYAPWGPLCDHVQASKGFEEIFPENFDHRNTDTLMDSLSVDDAEEAANKLWSRAREEVA